MGGYKEYIKNLSESTMFHMSLGSKELFHSNFLHWISIVNWDAFLKIMHGLADVEKFWWEDESVKDFRDKPYRPDNNNVKVFREHRNFDLSIYILDSETYKDETKNSNNNGIADDGNTTEYAHDLEGKEKIQKWLPVLVLENKMKSLPYVAQLEGYTQKAFEEWANIIKEKALKSSYKELTVSGNDQYSITFILLSLMQTKLAQYEFENTKAGKRPIFTLNLKSTWKHKIYKDLLNQLEKEINTNKFTGLDRCILIDYYKFVDALVNLAENWKINSGNSYRSQIYPWNSNALGTKEKREEINKYKELRIHDIHEKLLYNQLLQMLEGELNNKKIEFKRYNTKTFKNDLNNNTQIFTNTNYLHGIGIVEIFYSIKKDFKLFIQVQGDRYCHMVIYNGIVSEGTGSDGKKALSVNKEKVSQLNCLKTIKDTLGSYISIQDSTPSFPWIEKQPSWGRYGNDNIYQYVIIPPNTNIQDVINAIVKDIEKIRG